MQLVSGTWLQARSKLGCMDSVIRFVGTQKFQSVVDGVFEPSTCLVCGPHAFGNKLAHFKSVHSLLKGAMDLDQNA